MQHFIILYSNDSRDSRHYHHRRRTRSRSESRRHSPIDKKRLLEIARKNAISMLKSGVLPRISTNTKEKLMQKIRHGGKTIEELTNYCQKLSRAEDLGELSELSDSDGESLFRPFHHPFEVKDRGPIVMNIRVMSDPFCIFYGANSLYFTELNSNRTETRK
jgi:hypothetical protein